MEENNKKLPKSVINQIKKQAICAAQNEEIALRTIKETDEKIEEFVAAKRAKCDSERHVVAYTSAMDVIHKLTGNQDLSISDILDVKKVDAVILGNNCQKTEYSLKQTFLDAYQKPEKPEKVKEEKVEEPIEEESATSSPFEE